MKYLSELLLLTLSLILILIILDRVFNRFRITSLFVDIWLSIFVVIKRIGSWKGLLSLFIVWFVISGAGVSFIGIVIKNKYLIGLGGLIYGFWLLPLTPLMLITIILAMLMQKFIFKDKNVSIQSIKERFNEVKDKEFDITNNYIFYAKVDKRSWLN